VVSTRPGASRPPDNRIVVVDACTWQNFAVVDALWVLKARYDGVVYWTEATRHEIRRGVRAETSLQAVLDLENDWLGAPVRLEGPSLRQVDLIRRGLGGLTSAPLQHLGEAEAIAFLEQVDGSRRILITDDGPAADLARRRSSGIQVLDTAAVLAEAFTMDDIGCPAAYNLLKSIWSYPREVRVPEHHEVC
jgi:predicted nucleic acid-binding protein